MSDFDPDLSVETQGTAPLEAFCMISRWTGGRAIPRWAAWAGFSLGWAACAGCGVLNPALVNSLGGNPVNSLPNPDGYVLIVYSNLTASSISFRYALDYANGATEDSNLIVSAGEFEVVAENCDLTSYQLTSITISVPGSDSLEIPSDLGAVVKNRDYVCGNVIAVTVSGSPDAPDVTVEVF
jgi:hypothetical protein